MSYLITTDNEEVSKMVITADTILTIDIFHNIFFDNSSDDKDIVNVLIKTVDFTLYA